MKFLAVSGFPLVEVVIGGWPSVVGRSGVCPILSCRLTGRGSLGLDSGWQVTSKQFKVGERLVGMMRIS